MLSFKKDNHLVVIDGTMLVVTRLASYFSVHHRIAENITVTDFTILVNRLISADNTMFKLMSTCDDKSDDVDEK